MICIHSAAAAAVCYYSNCCFSCYVDTVCGFTTEYLDLLDIKCYYTIRCCMTYECSFVYTCHVLLLPPLLFCSVLLYYCLLLQLLLIAATVCQRVPDGKICCRGSLHLIPFSSFSSFKHDLFSMYPLAVLLCRTYSFDVLPIIV